MRIDASGNVGIGTSTPSVKLDVVVDASVNPVMRIRNTNASGFSGAQIFDNAGSLVAHFGYGGSSSTLSSRMYVGTIASQSLVFTTSDTERARIDSSGNVLVTGGGGLGYGAGSGGAVTQATSKTTAVTLNKPTGQITMNNAALGAAAVAIFTLNNSIISATDCLLVNQSSAGGTISGYAITPLTCSSGSATIRVTNISGGSLSEAVVINFSVIKAATT
jgi:hypothetical protein